MQDQQFWPGSKVPRSTNNAFNVANAGTITWSKMSAAQTAAIQAASARRANGLQMTIDRPVGSAEKHQGSAEKSKISVMKTPVKPFVSTKKALANEKPRAYAASKTSTKARITVVVKKSAKKK